MSSEDVVKKVNTSLISVKGKSNPVALDAIYRAQPVASVVAIVSAVLWAVLILPWLVVGAFTGISVPFIATASIAIPIISGVYAAYWDQWSKRTDKYIVTKEDHRQDFKNWKTGGLNNNGRAIEPTWIGGLQIMGDYLAHYDTLIEANQSPAMEAHLREAQNTTRQILTDKLSLFQYLRATMGNKIVEDNSDLRMETEQLVKAVGDLTDIQADCTSLYIRSRDDDMHAPLIEGTHANIKRKLEALLETKDLQIGAGTKPVSPTEAEVAARVAEQQAREVNFEVAETPNPDNTTSGKTRSQIQRMGEEIAAGIRTGRPQLRYSWETFELLMDSGQLDAAMDMNIDYMTNVAEEERKIKIAKEKAAAEEQRRRQQARAARFGGLGPIKPTPSYGDNTHKRGIK